MRTHLPPSRLLLLLAMLLLALPVASPRAQDDPPPPVRSLRPRPASDQTQPGLYPSEHPALEMIGTFGGESQYRAIAVSDSYAFVGSGTVLRIFDISDSAHPRPIGHANLPGYASDVQLVGDMAYVVTYSNYNEAVFNTSYGEGILQIVDVSNPQAPSLRGSEELGFISRARIKVVGTYAYVASHRLTVVAVGDPSDPRTISSYDLFGELADLDVVGTTVYLVGSYGLQIVDVSNPAEPVFQGRYTEEDRGSISNAYLAVDVVGSRAYIITDSAGLVVLDVSEASAPVRAGRYAGSFSGNSAAIEVIGSLAFVASAYIGNGRNSGSFTILDVSNPARPRHIRSISTSGIFAMEIAGTNLYASTGDQGLLIVDVSRPSSPRILGGYNSPDNLYNLRVVDEHLYLATFTEGLHIANVANPAAIRLLGNYDLVGPIRDLRIINNRAYMAADYSGLQILNVGNPLSPTLRGSFANPPNGAATAVDVVGNFAYVGGPDFNILDTSNPVSPTIRGSLSAIGPIDGIQVVGAYAYLAGRGLSIVDVKDSAKPLRRSNYDTGAHATDVVVIGDLAYVANSYGLDILDVSNPENPSLRGYFDVVAPPFIFTGLPFIAPRYDVSVTGSTAYLAHDAQGLFVLDVSDPARPRLVATHAGLARAVQVVGDRVYVAGDAFSILRVHPERFGFFQFLPLVRR